MVEVTANTTHTAAAITPQREPARRVEGREGGTPTPREGEETGAMAPQHMVAMMGNVATLMPWAAENQSAMRTVGEDDYTSCHGNPVVMEMLQAHHSAPPPPPEGGVLARRAEPPRAPPVPDPSPR